MELGGSIEPGASEVVDEEVAGQGGDPGLEAALKGVEAGEVLVELEEDVLGEVLGVGGGAGETVADGVDTTMLGDDELLPGLWITGDALANQPADCFLFGFLFRRPLQLCLEWSWEKCIAAGGGKFGFWKGFGGEDRGWGPGDFPGGHVAGGPWPGREYSRGWHRYLKNAHE